MSKDTTDLDIQIHNDINNNITRINDKSNLINDDFVNNTDIDLNLHNVSPEAHPDLRKAFEDLISHLITRSDITDAISKHNKNEEAHSNITKEITDDLTKIKNDIDNVQTDIDSATEKLNKNNKEMEDADTKLSKQMNDTYVSISNDIETHNTDPNAHQNRFTKENTKLDDTNSYLTTTLDAHNIADDAHQDIINTINTNINNFQSRMNNAVKLTGNQTISDKKIFTENLVTNGNFVSKKIQLNNNVNSNIDFLSNAHKASGAYIDGNTLNRNAWKRIALYEDAQSLINTAKNNAAGNITNIAAAWSRDRQMVPDGTRWSFSPDVTYTAPHNGFIRLEEIRGDWSRMKFDSALCTFVLIINNGVAVRTSGGLRYLYTVDGHWYDVGDNDEEWADAPLTSNPTISGRPFLSLVYPIRAGWTWRVGRESGDLWPTYMEYIQCYF